MAGSRKPGPLGLRAEVQNLNDGTMIRGLSLRPGTTKAKAISIAGPHGSSAETTPKTRTHNKKNINSGVQVLRQGSQGAEVKKLQRQLNVRLTPSPELAIDGTFGPNTFQAVLQYQRGVPIAADGIVGTQTWYHLLKGDKAATQPALSEPKVTAKNAPENPPQHVSIPLAPAKGIWEWPLEDKFAESLRRTGPKLPSSIRGEFEAMLSPTSLGVMAGTLVVWAGSHAFGIGEVVDIILLIGGAFFLGMSVLDVASDLGDFLVGTSTATEEKDLDEAATHLAKAIAVMGVAAFMALLAKVARGKGGAKTKESTSTPKPKEPVQSSSAPQRPQVSRPEPEPIRKPPIEDHAPKPPIEKPLSRPPMETVRKADLVASGMDPTHLKNLQDLCRYEKKIVVMRTTNPAALAHHGKPNIRAKPKEVKLKSAKEGPNAGLVTKDANDFSKMKKITEKQKLELMENEKKLLDSGHYYDEQGVLRDRQGNAYHSDYDMQGVYSTQPPPPHSVNTNEKTFINKMNREVCPENERGLLKHGANDNFKDPNDPTKPGRYPDEDELFTVVDENGNVSTKNLEELKNFYDKAGIKPWPY